MADSTVIDGVDYGPLAGLLGRWFGDKGVDRVPEPEGEERNLYHEVIEFTAIGDVTNAEKQTLAIVRYHQVVSRKSNDEVFHDQVGYWTWDSSDNTIVQTFIIPRGVAVIAEGVLAKPDPFDAPLRFSVSASEKSGLPQIAQSSFMQENARTTGFSIDMELHGDTLKYTQTTLLDIYGRAALDHTDINTLQRQP
ncbi:MAG: heme-binding beta-barrel domain-containing protein [Halioglobus sp.]